MKKQEKEKLRKRIKKSLELVIEQEEFMAEEMKKLSRQGWFSRKIQQLDLGRENAGHVSMFYDEDRRTLTARYIHEKDQIYEIEIGRRTER